MLLFALSLPLLLCATGMGVDYAVAMRLQTQLMAAADAAALTATSRTAMQLSASDARVRAVDVFKLSMGRQSGLSLNYNDPTQFDVIVTDQQTNGKLRRAEVRFNGTSKNTFAAFVGLQTLPLKGFSQSTSKAAPNVDFYVMMDNSSSMDLATKTADMDWMRSKTITAKEPGGCAFACHETNPADTNPNMKDSTGKVIDYYTFAKNNGIELRVDAGRKAIIDMIDTAQREGRNNDVIYRFSVSTFNTAANFKSIAPLTADYSLAKTQVATLSSALITTGSTDRVTEHDRSLGEQLKTLPLSGGNGSNGSNDTPQAFVIMITDGMRDEDMGGRQIGAMLTSNYEAIKRRNVRIAVLYTTYDPYSLKNHSWSRTNIYPKLPSIRPSLEKCSSDAMVYEVKPNGDISQALNTLFLKALATSRLTR